MQRKNKSNTYKNNFQELLNFVSDYVMVVNQEGVVLAANKTAIVHFGLSSEELINHNIKNLKIIDEKTKALLKNQLEKRIKGEKIENYEIPIFINGETRYFEPIGNKINYFGETADLILLRDVSEKKRVQRQLLEKIAKMDERCQESEGKYQKLFQESLDAIFIADAQTGIILDCNNAAVLLVGWTKSDLIGKHYSVLHTQPLRETSVSTEFKEKEQVYPTKPIETQMITKTGEIKYISFRICFFEFNGKKLMQGTFRDVTERKIMQQALQENEAKFRGIANSVKDAVILVNEKARVTYWNPAAEKIFGYGSEEALGKDIHKLVVPNAMSNEAKGRIGSSVKVFTETGIGYFTVGNVELVGRRKDGAEFPAEISRFTNKVGWKMECRRSSKRHH